MGKMEMFASRIAEELCPKRWFKGLFLWKDSVSIYVFLICPSSLSTRPRRHLANIIAALFHQKAPEIRV